MLGRLTQDKINKVIDELSLIIHDKYTVMMTPPQKLKDPNSLKRYKVL
jgi:hypothetical protein